MTLTSDLQEIALKNGINYFGVADLTLAKKAILDQGGEEIAAFPYSITLGISLINHIVDQLPNRSQQSVALNYRHHAYDLVNQRLDMAASILSSYIQQQGHKVLPLPAAKHTDDERICAAFSHKMGAHLSGLGWIGKSCLLVTPKDGPRVRWTTILTDAPLIPTGTPLEEQCGECTACVDICPMKAFTGRNFREDEPREARYDARRCQKYFEAMKKKGEIGVCGMCLYVCPFGRSHSAV